MNHSKFRVVNLHSPRFLKDVIGQDLLDAGLEYFPKETLEETVKSHCKYFLENNLGSVLQGGKELNAQEIMSIFPQHIVQQFYLGLISGAHMYRNKLENVLVEMQILSRADKTE